MFSLAPQMERGSPAEPGDANNYVLVMGLPQDATEREVRVLFSGCEGFADCAVISDGMEKRPTALVHFSSRQDAHAAVVSRMGSCWEEADGPIHLQLLDSSIVELLSHCTDRRTGEPSALAQAPLLGSFPGEEGAGHSEPSQPKAERESLASRVSSRTLHVGGLPAAVTQEELDQFLQSVFGKSCMGSKLQSGSGKGPTSLSRAFIGFTTGQNALYAQTLLNGFRWGDATLRAEWARSEFRSSLVQKGGAVWKKATAKAAPGSGASSSRGARTKGDQSQVHAQRPGAWPVQSDCFEVMQL